VGDMLSFLSQEDLIFMRADAREAVLNFEAILHGVSATRPVSFMYRRLLTQSMNVSSGVTTTTWEDTRISGFGGVQVMYARDATAVGDPCVMFDPTVLSSPPKDQDRVLLYVTVQGYLSLVSGSASVTGTDTEFEKHGVQGGDVLIDCDITNSKLPIASVQSNTQLTLSSNWTGATTPYVKYEIFRSHVIIDRKIDPMGALIRLGLKRAGA
jgi:hypothetical protein